MNEASSNPVDDKSGIGETITSALRQPSFLRVMLLLAAMVVVFVGMRLAAPILDPILFAVVLALLFSPIYAWLRGLIALLFGLVVLFWPGLVLTVLALLFGLYAAVDGVITLVPALRSQDRGAQRTLPLAEGAVGIIAGLVALLWPGLTVSGLVYVIAGWAVVTGVLKIFTAILLRTEVENGWLLAGSGALSVLFGIVLAALARSDVPFLAPFIGGFAVVVGLALIVFAFRLRERRP